jgi:hemerythrin superfamily protein
MDIDIITAIKEDHQNLKDLFQTGLSRKTTLEEKKDIFEVMIVLITAHTKSEEVVVYAPTCRNPQTKKNAFEGFEEHALVELLIEEMKTESNDDKWEAKFTVICNLLDRHVDDEEENYLPKLKAMFNDIQRTEMGREYKQTFDKLMKAQNNILHINQPSHSRNN